MLIIPMEGLLTLHLFLTGVAGLAAGLLRGRRGPTAAVSFLLVLDVLVLLTALPAIGQYGDAIGLCLAGGVVTGTLGFTVGAAVERRLP